MGTVGLNDFFKEFSIDKQVADYEIIRHYIKALDAVSRISGQSLYLKDYCKKGFAYVSDNPLFLCGYTAQEVLEMGYSFYEKVVPPEDFEMILEINQKGLELFYQQPIETRLDMAISYDFRITRKNNLTTMINHKLTPIQFSENGDIWLALCMVNLSSQKTPGNVYMSMNGLLQRYLYSFKSKKWKDAEIITLSQREKEILQLSIQGCPNDEIAGRLFIDVNTVKFHKKNIFQKFKVKNITEAINFVQNNNLVIE